MAEILFVTWDGGGNVAPAIEIARELRTRGHSVRFLGHERQRDFFRREDFGFTSFTRPGFWTATGKRGTVRNALGFLQLVTGRSLGRDLLTEVRRAPADIVVIDCLLFGALDAAVRGGLAHAVLVHSLYEAIDTKIAGGPAGAIARLVGLRPRRLWADADVVLVATLEALDRPVRPTQPNTHYTGPALPAVATPSVHPPEKRILVSLSTTYLPGQVEVLQKVMDALSDLPVSVVLTTGPAVDPAALRPAANAEVHAYLPHADVMTTVSLVIGHGGHSTTMLALANDVPLLIIPMNLLFDQVLIGEAVQRAKAGLALTSGASPQEIRAAVVRLLEDESFRRNAASLGQAIREAHGARAAADHVEALSPAALPAG